MTQEDKELLLTDLCGRLPYTVVCLAKYEREDEIDHEYYMQDVTDELFSISKNNAAIIGSQLCSLENCKPYLRSMSSMTEDEWKEFAGIDGTTDEWIQKIPVANYYFEVSNYKQIDWLNARHFDYRGLIPMGLALEAPEGMYDNREKICTSIEWIDMDTLEAHCYNCCLFDWTCNSCKDISLCKRPRSTYKGFYKEKKIKCYENN